MWLCSLFGKRTEFLRQSFQCEVSAYFFLLKIKNTMLKSMGLTSDFVSWNQTCLLCLVSKRENTSLDLNTSNSHTAIHGTREEIQSIFFTKASVLLRELHGNKNKIHCYLIFFFIFLILRTRNVKLLDTKIFFEKHEKKNIRQEKL